MGIGKTEKLIPFLSIKEHIPFTYTAYRSLWFLLEVIGIEIWQFKTRERSDIENNSLKSLCKKLRVKLFPFVFYTYLIYSVMASLALAILGGIHPEVIVTFVSINLLSLALWYHVYKKRARIKTLFIKCHKMTSQTGARNTKRVVNIYLSLVILISFLSATVCALFLKKSPVQYRTYYSLFVPYKENILCIVTRNITLQLSFFSMYAVPSLVAILCGLIYSKCNEALSVLHGCVQNLSEVPFQYEVSKLMKRHNLTLHLVCGVEKELSPLSFLLLCSLLLNMYKALATYIAVDNAIIFSALIWDCVPAITLMPLCLVGVTMSASRISSSISDIQASLQMNHNVLLNKDRLNLKTTELLRAMLKTEFPKMTSGGIMELKPGLIFSVFGTLFTYGLLIRSVKKD
ncbi:uncharacterized protein TNCT_654511 [Trichonephila clavata]|uniref:Uncharacterized protein n=1 Tax=Trichonephila clavata TaxID=2740835 RepID=A0A8X6FAM6_TRICU|nr:uncharacterized protein TNCT_654511 [Trichonephila clavata]